ncbi:hypothetical protein NPX13_g2343 [Xylaria arbuscula]|uniref:4-hydroxybenzoate polyprenyltransferase, mitochondrial n=1 Tax=Xylaria arbuscula TaxID=114810 RepID=A0A9W8NJS6_9PEZI|nr:hypothetical protein NPX13_g2343 [Xylaria arbuscula]
MTSKYPKQEFAHPEYTPPRTGILAYVPPSWVPFVELARIDRPTGIYLFYWPHIFGVLYASSLNARHGGINLYDVVYKSMILFVGTVFFRAAACSWNDTMDIEYDRQVLRCRLRPLARGAVIPLHAHIFTGSLTILALACLYVLPKSCWVISLPSIFLLWLYPFAKRFTDFPQLILGIQVGIGYLMGLAAVDGDLLNESAMLYQPLYGHNHLALGAFYTANICWTMVYDTVYAQQDVEDDAKAGVRSMAVRFRGMAKPLLWALSIAMTILLLTCGCLQGFGHGYMAFSCGGVLISLAYQMLTIDLRSPNECSWFFRKGTWFVGLSICSGLILEALSIR